MFTVAQKYDEKCRHENTTVALTMQQLRSEGGIDFVAIEI